MIEVTTLIEEVQKRPALWDQGHQHRHNRDVLEGLWEEVGRVFGAPPEEVRKKWKGLRDTFRKELRKYPNGFDQDLSQDEYPPWVFFKPLYFLKGQMKRAPRRGDLASHGDGFHYLLDGAEHAKLHHDDDDSEDILERVDMDPSVCNTLRTLGARGVKRAAADEVFVDDEDYHFFLSLLPHVRKLAPLRKLQLRSRIQDLVVQEVYHHEIADPDADVLLVTKTEPV